MGKVGKVFERAAKSVVKTVDRGVGTDFSGQKAKEIKEQNEKLLNKQQEALEQQENESLLNALTSDEDIASVVQGGTAALGDVGTTNKRKRKASISSALGL